MFKNDFFNLLHYEIIETFDTKQPFLNKFNVIFFNKTQL